MDNDVASIVRQFKPRNEGLEYGSSRGKRNPPGPTRSMISPISSLAEASFDSSPLYSPRSVLT